MAKKSLMLSSSMLLSSLLALWGCGLKPAVGTEPTPASAAECATASQSYQDDIAPLLNANCISCHSGAGASAGVQLDTYDSVVSNSARALDAMSNGSMPPGGALAASQVDTFRAWAEGGLCQVVGNVDAGTAESDAGEVVDQYACPSGQTWPAGAEGRLMNPGMSCISCHAAQGEGPTYSLAGTVFDRFHSADLCYGAADVQVEITDANQQVITLTTNATGNFYSSANIAFPATAKVKRDGLERAMVAAVPHGDCAACHTVEGANGAPGRIVAP